LPAPEAFFPRHHRTRADGPRSNRWGSRRATTSRLTCFARCNHVAKSSSRAAAAAAPRNAEPSGLASVDACDVCHENLTLFSPAIPAIPPVHPCRPGSGRTSPASSTPVTSLNTISVLRVTNCAAQRRCRSADRAGRGDQIPRETRVIGPGL